MTEPQQDAVVRVLVADDQQLMRDGLTSLLSIQEGVEVVGVAANGQEALAQALVLQPDVILMDVRMPVMDGVAATAEIHHQLPSCQILMLTTFDDDDYVTAALRAGASGYLLKDIPAQHLAQAIRAAHRRIYQLDSAVVGRLLSSLVEPKAQQALPAEQASQPEPAHSNKESGLTAREIAVLRLIAQGATNREIAEQLVISEGTVKNHISNMLGRLGLRDRTQAAIYAREHGLL